MKAGIGSPKPAHAAAGSAVSGDSTTARTDDVLGIQPPPASGSVTGKQVEHTSYASIFVEPMAVHADLHHNSLCYALIRICQDIIHSAAFLNMSTIALHAAGCRGLTVWFISGADELVYSFRYNLIEQLYEVFVPDLKLEPVPVLRHMSFVCCCVTADAYCYLGAIRLSFPFCPASQIPLQCTQRREVRCFDLFLGST